MKKLTKEERTELVKKLTAEMDLYSDKADIHERLRDEAEKNNDSTEYEKQTLLYCKYGTKQSPIIGKMLGLLQQANEQKEVV